MVYVSKPCRECGGIVYRSYLCRECHNRTRRDANFAKRVGPDGKPKPCRLEGCGRPVTAKMLCQTHYKQMRKGETFSTADSSIPCAVPACDKMMRKNSLICKKHMRFAWRYSLSPEAVINIWGNPVCSNPGCTNSTDLHMDHDHACCSNEPGEDKAYCGKCNRGLLCRGCNIALGMVDDSVERIAGLLKHLEASSANRNSGQPGSL